jgi:hypothetical protein
MHATLITCIETTISELQEASDRGGDWICSRIAANGRPAGADRINSYYRLPWSLAVAGRRKAASSVLAWLAQEVLDAHGDLLSGAPREPFQRSIASYPLSQIVIGAWHLEQYDIALRTLHLLETSFVDARSGGVFSERPELRSTGRADLLSTAQLGLAALTVGRSDLAKSCCDWMLQLYGQQPELPDRLYPCRVGNELLSQTGGPHSAWDVVTDFQRPFQQFYNPGIAAAFLGRYAMCTGDANALRVAKAFLDLNIGGAQLQFDYTVNAQACKFGWGVAVVLDAEPSKVFADHALGMARWFVASQHPDGHWRPSPFLAPDPDDGDNMPKTAEHLLHVVTLISALAKYGVTLRTLSAAER